MLRVSDAPLTHCREAPTKSYLIRLLEMSLFFPCYRLSFVRMIYRVVSRTIISVFFSVTLLVSAAVSQDFPPGPPIKSEQKEPPKLFTKDELDAIQVAGAFSREWQRTKDLRPLLANYGVPDYGQSIAKNEDAAERYLISEELLAKADPRSTLDLHVALNNWLYLHTTWGLHQEDYEDDPKPPPDIEKVFRKDPYLSRLLDLDSDDESSDFNEQISTQAGLLRTVETLEQAAILYRGKLLEFPARKSKTYLTNLSEMTDEGDDLYKPDTHTCESDEGCFGIPKGKEYVHLTIEPMFFVVLVRSSGRMKIAYITFPFDD